jgi:hypothetical protein
MTKNEMLRASSLYALQTAFDVAGVEFFDGDNGGAGVRFKQRGGV